MLRKKMTFAALCLIMAAKAATAQAPKTDSSNYQSRKLKTEEVNFVTGYYQQNGNNAAVTGGVGDEHLTDVATTFSIKLSKYDKKHRKRSIDAQVGIDVYTSASSDQIDASTVSSASSSDARLYPSLNYSIQNDSNRFNLGGGLSFSNEYDYTSYGGNLHFTKWSKDKSSELTVKASVFLDSWKVILPLELRPSGYGSGAEDDPLPIDNKARNSYNLGLIYSKIVNKNFQVALLADLTFQEGLLATKYHRVFFNDGTLKAETLPETRTKIPIGIRANYFLGDNIVLRSYYRYYWDNWGVKAHTVSLEASYKFTPFISLAPSYRFYAQSAADHFAPYLAHNPNENYFTSDYDLSKFNSSMFGLNLRVSNLNKKTFVKKLNALELRYGYYTRNTNLNAHTITMALNFK